MNRLNRDTTSPISLIASARITTFNIIVNSNLINSSIVLHLIQYQDSPYRMLHVNCTVYFLPFFHFCPTYWTIHITIWTSVLCCKGTFRTYMHYITWVTPLTIYYRGLPRALEKYCRLNMAEPWDLMATYLYTRESRIL
jgi:hypothetical protein